MRNPLLFAAIFLGASAVPLMTSGKDDASASAVKDAILKRFTEEFVPLAPGKKPYPASFTMGSAGNAPKSEQPAFHVTLKAPFALARHEVTQELYAAVMGRNPSRWKGPRNSVEMVSWKEANDFCRKVTSALQARKLLAPDQVIRLPSEAEWEYACRAGSSSAYSFGDAEAKLKDYAWYKDNSKGEDPPVGKKRPNAWGFHDMHGYVLEWCADAWHPSYKGAPTDGSAWDAKDATERVIRGGSWKDPAEQCRSAARRSLAAGARDDAVGFRCVRGPASQSPKGNRK